MTKANNSQTKSIANVGVIHFLLTVTGVVQAILIGRIFGISRPIEIYFAAVVLYRSIFGLLQTGQIVEIATPKYHQIKVKDVERAANSFFSALLELLAASSSRSNSSSLSKAAADARSAATARKRMGRSTERGLCWLLD